MYFSQYHVIYVRLDQYQYVYDLLNQYPDVKVKKFVSEYSIAASISIEMPEYHPQMDEIINILLKYNNNNPYKYDESDYPFHTLFFHRYSKEDYLSADWLQVYSHFMNIKSKDYLGLYNRTCPVKLSFESGNEKDGFFHACHQKHIVLRSTVNWRNKYFASLAMDQDFLFCKEQAKRILENNNIKGIDYLPVHKQSTDAYLEDIYCISGSSPFPNDAIAVLSNTPVTYCPVCKERVIISKQKLLLGIRKGVLDPDIDYYLTPPMLSPNVSDPSHAIGTSINIISQRMYRVLKENDMARSLAFEPLPTVEN